MAMTIKVHSKWPVIRTAISYHKISGQNRHILPQNLRTDLPYLTTKSQDRTAISYHKISGQNRHILPQNLKTEPPYLTTKSQDRTALSYHKISGQNRHILNQSVQYTNSILAKSTCWQYSWIRSIFFRMIYSWDLHQHRTSLWVIQPMTCSGRIVQHTHKCCKTQWHGINRDKVENNNENITGSFSITCEWLINVRRGISIVKGDLKAKERPSANNTFS
jgi:hypothetical protein